MPIALCPPDPTKDGGWHPLLGKKEAAVHGVSLTRGGKGTGARNKGGGGTLQGEGGGAPKGNGARNRGGAYCKGKGAGQREIGRMPEEHGQTARRARSHASLAMLHPGRMPPPYPPFPSSTKHKQPPQPHVHPPVANNPRPPHPQTPPPTAPPHNPSTSTTRTAPVHPQTPPPTDPTRRILYGHPRPACPPAPTDNLRPTRGQVQKLFLPTRPHQYKRSDPPAARFRNSSC